MKIIITEDQYNMLLESTDNSNVVEQILDMDGIKYDGCEYDGRTRDSFGRTYDSVVFYFEFPNDYKHRSIRFLTKNNKVVSVSSSSDFRNITDGFKYIPTNVLMSYFIEKGKRHLEKTLSDMYFKDNLKESVIKEESLATMILNRIKDDGWADTAELVGGTETLLEIIGYSKENVISFFLSHYNNLHIEKRGGEILLMDGGLPLLHKPSTLFNSDLRAYDDYFKSRLNINTYGIYGHYRKDIIRELVSRFPELYSKEVNVYKDSGLYQKYHTFYL